MKQNGNYSLEGKIGFVKVGDEFIYVGRIRCENYGLITDEAIISYGRIAAIYPEFYKNPNKILIDLRSKNSLIRKPEDKTPGNDKPKKLGEKNE